MGYTKFLLYAMEKHQGVGVHYNNAGIPIYTRYIKIWIWKRKYIGIAMKSKETSSQLETVINSHVAIIYHPVTVSSTM